MLIDSIVSMIGIKLEVCRLVGEAPPDPSGPVTVYDTLFDFIHIIIGRDHTVFTSNKLVDPLKIGASYLVSSYR